MQIGTGNCVLDSIQRKCQVFSPSMPMNWLSCEQQCSLDIRRESGYKYVYSCFVPKGFYFFVDEKIAIKYKWVYDIKTFTSFMNARKKELFCTWNRCIFSSWIYRIEEKYEERWKRKMERRRRGQKYNHFLETYLTTAVVLPLFVSSKKIRTWQSQAKRRRKKN